ncbi:9957_t:CDS:1, partial [Gigaspora margarita]
EELDFIKFRDEIKSSAVKVTYTKEDNQEKFSQKKKQVINECGIIDYSLEEIQVLEFTKKKNIKQVMVEKTNINLSNTIVEPTITNREIEVTTSQEKPVTKVEKIEKPIKRELTSERKEENNPNPETKKKNKVQEDIYWLAWALRNSNKYCLEKKQEKQIYFCTV